MAVPTTTAGVATRYAALITEVTELETGCRGALTGSAAANDAAQQLGPQFGQIKAQLTQPGLTALKSLL
jgi:hypothetical protein